MNTLNKSDFRMSCVAMHFVTERLDININGEQLLNLLSLANLVMLANLERYVNMARNHVKFCNILEQHIFRFLMQWYMQ